MADLNIISQEIKNLIISGKDVNSNLLLSPNYETPIKRKDHDKGEGLSRNLSLVEFIIFFDRYKRIMCSAFSSRAELDLCKFDEVVFIKYHKLFAAKCATTQHSDGLVKRLC